MWSTFGSKHTSKGLKDKEGVVLKTEKEQLIRWAEHFNELLNKPELNKLPNFDLTNVHNLNIVPEGLTRDELEAALKTVKNNKASGCDEITGEMLKALNETSKDYLLTIFNEIWNNETLPQEWRNGIIVKLPKKGDLGDCNNWRGITLLSSVGKFFCTILLKEVDSILQEEQAGFRPGRSCCDQIFVLISILEECLEWNTPLCHEFLGTF